MSRALHDEPAASPSRLRAAPWWCVSISVHAVALGLLCAISAGAGVDALLPDDGLVVSLAPGRGPAGREELPEETPEDRPPAPVERRPVAPMEAPGSGAQVRPSSEEPPPPVLAQTAPGGGGGPGDVVGGGQVEQPVARSDGDTVRASLRWLARHQGPDGGWSCAGFSACCAGTPCSGGGAAEGDVAATGLALLAFLGGGYTHLSCATYVDPCSGVTMSFGTTVQRGLAWLVGRQATDGRIGDDPLGQAIAAFALTEAWGLTNAATYKGPTQRAVDQLLGARSPRGGWRGAVGGDDDPFVTGWAVMALESAHIGQLVPRTSMEEVRAWLDGASDPSGSLCGEPALVPGPGRPHPTTVAIGLALRIYLESNQRDPRLAPAAKRLLAEPPRREAADAYHWFFATLALTARDGGGWFDDFDRWRKALEAALLPGQRLERSGCADGSWDPQLDRWGAVGGRVGVTALSVLSLETYPRHRSVFRR